MLDVICVPVMVVEVWFLMFGSNSTIKQEPFVVFIMNSQLVIVIAQNCAR